MTAEDFKKGVIKLMIDAPREPKNRVFDKCVGAAWWVSFMLADCCLSRRLKRGSDGRFADGKLEPLFSGRVMSAS